MIISEKGNYQNERSVNKIISEKESFIYQMWNFEQTNEEIILQITVRLTVICKTSSIFKEKINPFQNQLY